MRPGAIYEWDFVRKKATDDLREKLMNVCCEEFNCTIEELKSKSRQRNISNARMVFSTICRKRFNDTMMRIGMELNKRHESVMYFLRKIEDFEYTKDPVVKRMELIERKIFNP